jgi:hypothetical protein
VSDGAKKGPQKRDLEGTWSLVWSIFPGKFVEMTQTAVHRLRHNQRESRQSEYHIVSATPESVCTELGFCEIGLWDWNSSFSRT